MCARKLQFPWTRNIASIMHERRDAGKGLGKLQDDMIIVFAESIGHLFVLYILLSCLEIFRNFCGYQDRSNFCTLSFRENLHNKSTGRCTIGLPQAAVQDIHLKGWR